MAKELNEPRSLRDRLMNPNPKKQFYIEPNCLPVSGKILLGGQAKTGKSFCATELSRALATGTNPFYSPEFTCPKPVKVFLLDKELGDESMTERALSFAKGCSPEQYELFLDNFIAVSGNPEFKFDSEECRQPIIECLDQVQPQVVVVDPVTKFMEGSDQENDHVKRFLEFIDVLIERYQGAAGTSFIFTHHFKKPAHDWQGNEVDPLSPYNFRGGSKWYDDMDSLITMRRHDIDSEHWKLECAAEFRHGKSPESFWLDVRPNSDRPVTQYERAQRGLEAPGGLKGKAPAIRR